MSPLNARDAEIARICMIADDRASELADAEGDHVCAASLHISARFHERRWHEARRASLNPQEERAA
jgi:hypothetical protein